MTALRPRRTRVGKRNQVTIPAEMLRHLGVAPGEDVEVVEGDGSVTIRKADDPIARAYGMLHRPGEKPMDIEEINEIIRSGAEEVALRRYLRTFE